MKNIKDIIIGVFAVIGFAAIVTGFTNEAIQSNKIDVENKSTVDYKVCIYCYGRGEGSFNLGWGKSTSVSVPCQSGDLEIKVRTF